ncbi:unnamed protein product [Cylindrotheca closterium]|uniref:Isochorismate synthase n=1 Tax=Cylindrotheca closterium TaxID=2856 RepID=A0AAD2JJD8_9STRA|nr:unnamed protein product [Cylindrotheca closterium]
MKRHPLHKLAVLAATAASFTNAFTTTSSHYSNSVKLPFLPKTAQHASVETTNEGHLVNGKTNGAPSELELDTDTGRTLSPYNILYPEHFRITSSEIMKRESTLHTCLQLLRQVLTFISSGDATLPEQARVLRIEHAISHNIDPLCWLQAQKEADDKPPSLYFATAEGTLEAAVYGSSKIYRGTTFDDHFWDLVQELPEESHFYGGQRFDTETDHSHVADEWASFSKGLWILPAIEIRRTKESPADTMATTTVAVHLYKDDGDDSIGFSLAASRLLTLLTHVSDATTPAKAPTTLPPVLSRVSTYANRDGQEMYETGVSAALAEFSKDNNTLEKVVLARRMDLSFSQHATVDPLDILRKWKFGNKPGGHMFCIGAGGEGGDFFGCTPERLFQVQHGAVVSEALAGTRPRGSTQDADEELARQLYSSSKDQMENRITGKFIRSAFEELKERGLVTVGKANTLEDSSEDYEFGGTFYVRRLRHLQHLCQRYSCDLTDNTKPTDVIKFLLKQLHPTPAVCGFPQNQAIEFIREYESSNFDRGFYSGPVGFVSKQKTDIVVAIRSGLASKALERPKISVYAGAGIVPGSTVQGEWSETSYKLAVVSSIFPQSPITLQSIPTPNAAWAAAFIEELVRNGITQFYICPGSRSTPLVAAIAKTARTNIGAINAMSIHDERGAGFRALGYGRGFGQPAAVITSSGTAIANLYPSIIEAGMDGVPLLVITADRPYENRNTGANQAIDQVKAFSSTYVRWFRDILPPSDDVPVAVGLSDASHGVNVAREQRGPVHLNIQFRENLAPDAGPIRNDDRIGSITKFDGVRFTDTPGFQRWSFGGGVWTKSFGNTGAVDTNHVAYIAKLIKNSKRGIIVVGNIRKSTTQSHSDVAETFQMIDNLAKIIGFPIFASAQSGGLRFESSAVVPFAEHLLRCPLVGENLRPDVVIQFGSPLISTEVTKVIKTSTADDNLQHVLVHPHHPSERVDPEFTVSQKVDSEILPFVKYLCNVLATGPLSSSSLSPIIGLGRSIQNEIRSIVDTAAADVWMNENGTVTMTEPEIILSLSELISRQERNEYSLFLSNSMPIRDAEAFLYPLSTPSSRTKGWKGVVDIAVNRGASGIDGIISSAAGFADATKRKTILLVGDVGGMENSQTSCEGVNPDTFLLLIQQVAALHDINSLHGLKSGITGKDIYSQYGNHLTTVVVNNGGGGIFSFLPLSKHGTDVGFEEFFATPTTTFSFEKGAAAFDLPYQKVRNFDELFQSYLDSEKKEQSGLIEVEVVARDSNVKVHGKITREISDVVVRKLGGHAADDYSKEILPLAVYNNMHSEKSNRSSTSFERKTMVLLHGWMGDKSEWDGVVQFLIELLPPEWSVISIDLPGHGESRMRRSNQFHSIREALGLREESDSNLDVDQIARSVFVTLRKHNIDFVDAIAGYSLGGRVALAMKRMAMNNYHDGDLPDFSCLNDSSRLVLVSAFPGDISSNATEVPLHLQNEHKTRKHKDDRLSQEIQQMANNFELTPRSPSDAKIHWSKFLQRWYSAPLWGNLKSSGDLYNVMIDKRVSSLSNRAFDLAAVLEQCSPPLNRLDDWRAAQAERTLFITGDLDEKYSRIGDAWQSLSPTLSHKKLKDKGHALLTEAPSEIAEAINSFLQTDPGEENSQKEAGEIDDKISSIPPYPKDSNRMDSAGIAATASKFPHFQMEEVIGSLEFEPFAIDLVDGGKKTKGVAGIGWGDRSKTAESSMKRRHGFIIQLSSEDGTKVGIGEVSPLAGLHPESLGDTEDQLNAIASEIAGDRDYTMPGFDPAQILAMDGALDEFLYSFCVALGIERLLLSVRSGIEMALIALSSQIVSMPIHQALVKFSPSVYKVRSSSSFLPLNGLVTRGTLPLAISDKNAVAYDSWKFKIGHQSPANDLRAISTALQLPPSNAGGQKPLIRADGNRGFNETEALEFLSAIRDIGLDRLEYIEEPLRVASEMSSWSLREHTGRLQKLYEETRVPFALDESIVDLAELHSYDFSSIMEDLKRVVPTRSGCVALILKPSLLGLELSLRLARAAKIELNVGAVFTSAFENGVGLSFIAFLASLSDQTGGRETTRLFSHGLGTFEMLSADCLSPNFASYVNTKGQVNVASLSRAFFGLSLDEMESLSSSSLPLLQAQLSDEDAVTASSLNDVQSSGRMLSDEFEASTTISSDGREITVVASLPLPFSAEIANARFTDLPQQPRWSPWISSVAYLDDGETEWTLQVRGIHFRWRATSTLLEEPYKGIQWESVSGLKNTGFVEFIPEDDACLMKVTIAFISPRILSSLFRGTSVFFEDFLRNKIFKWSLEMFRDVVKGDLALEEGNIDLGDALFSSVEGKANAIQASLSAPFDT